MNVMFTFDIEKNLTGIVVNVPCPSQDGDWFTVMTADYWSNVREKVAEIYGPDVYILPQCAVVGDLTPYTYHYQEAFRRRFRLKYGCYDNLVSPKGGQQLVEETLKMLYEKVD